jgi:hypothetical protein
MSSTAMMTCDDKRNTLTITHNDFYKWVLEKDTEHAKRWSELDMTAVDEYIPIEYEWCPDKNTIRFIIAYGENKEFRVKKTYDTDSVFALWLSIVVGFAEEYVE